MNVLIIYILMLIIPAIASINVQTSYNKFKKCIKEKIISKENLY